MYIYILRHGETESNEQGRLQGWTNDSLNNRGIFLAQETGKALIGKQFDAVFSSPLIRSRQTAEIILRESGIKANIIIDERIKEINMGNYEGKFFKGEKCEIDSSFVKAFFSNPIELSAFPNGENVKNVMTRTQEFLKELATKEYESVLVVTHGCALRCMLNFLYEYSNDFWQGHVPYNCCLNIVESFNGRMRLIKDDIILYDKNLCVDRYAEF